MMSKGLLHPERLVTHEVALTAVTDAFAQADREDPQTIKVVMDVQAV